VVSAMRKHPETWVNYMMHAELGLEEPDRRRALTSALTIGGAYIAGGSIPLAPYFFVPGTGAALLFSVIATLCALLLFGTFKGHFTGAPPLRSGLQTLLIGGLAATAAFLIAKAIS
jgi:VIT1/CCC1 family predicted Fe2+/Mn2+ transporter